MTATQTQTNLQAVTQAKATSEAKIESQSTTEAAAETETSTHSGGESNLQALAEAMVRAKLGTSPENMLTGMA